MYTPVREYLQLGQSSQVADDDKVQVGRERLTQRRSGTRMPRNRDKAAVIVTFRDTDPENG